MEIIMPETHEVSPSDKVGELISHFLRQAERVGEADPSADPSDVFGIRPLMFLIKALSIIGAPEAEWNRIAEYALRQAKGGSAIYYKPILSELVPHVTSDMVEQIRKHFVSNGELGALMNLLRLRAWRNPSSDEIRGIATYLRKNASSTAPFWQGLLELAPEADIEFIEALRLEVQLEEESDEIPF